MLSLLVAIFFTGSFSDNLAFAQKDKGDDKPIKILQNLLNDLIATVENLSNVVAQLQADITELKNNEGSSVSPVYVNRERITTAASDISTYSISCDSGDVAQSGNFKIKTDKTIMNFIVN